MGATDRAGHRDTAIPDLRSSLGYVSEGRRRSIVVIGSIGFMSGLAEALFLVMITQTAFAITAEEDHVELSSYLHLSVRTALILALIVVLSRIALTTGSGLLVASLTSHAGYEFRDRVLRGFFGADWTTQQSERSGSVQELAGYYAGQATTLLGQLCQGLVGAANLIAMVGLAIAMDPLGAAVLVVSVAVLANLLRPLRRIIRRLAIANNEAGLEFATTVNEVSQFGMELHVFNVQAEAGERLDRLSDESRMRTRRLAFASSMTSPVYTGLAYLAVVGALGVVATSNTSSLASLGAVMLVMLRSLSYGQNLQNIYAGISATAPAVLTLTDRLASYELGRQREGSTPLESVGRIEVGDLTFAYVPGQPVLQEVSFTIEPHEVVGIVGPSGGGKSTLVELLLGLREPTTGHIRVDGTDIHEFRQEHWARRITFVPQAAHLIRGSIADNIRFMRPGVTQAHIERAARLAHVHADIEAFPERYEREVGEHGGHLSGGQQQRLCIARALVEDPDVLILDEPTSALDVRSEDLIRTTLLGLRERMTIIIIAHRLSTLGICDRIMVIQGGRMKGFDTPTRLEETNDFYREALVLSGMR